MSIENLILGEFQIVNFKEPQNGNELVIPALTRHIVQWIMIKVVAKGRIGNADSPPASRIERSEIGALPDRIEPIDEIVWATQITS